MYNLNIFFVQNHRSKIYEKYILKHFNETSLQLFFVLKTYQTWSVLKYIYKNNIIIYIQDTNMDVDSDVEQEDVPI